MLESTNLSVQEVQDNTDTYENIYKTTIWMSIYKN